jgi:hypothetical protein
MILKLCAAVAFMLLIIQIQPRLKKYVYGYINLYIYIYIQKYYFENSLIEVKMIAIMKRVVHLWGFKKA